MEFLTEISRLVDGALKGDRPRVIDYTKQLAIKLRSVGDEKAAERLERAISQAGKTVGIQHVNQSIPVDGESRFPLADELFVEPGAVRVYLDERVEQRVQEFLQHVRHSDALLAEGVGLVPTLLLSGLPGTGKSLTARYIAAQLGLPLLISRVDTLVSSYLGSTAKNLRNLFEHASRRGCILFLDEIDALAKLRDDQHEMGELKRVVIALLQNIDQVRSHTVIVAATNHAHILDSAIWRRFQFHLQLELPQPAARGAIIRERINGRAIGIPLKKVVEATETLSGADIAGIIDDAIRNAVVYNLETIDACYVLRRIAEHRLGEQINGLADAGKQLRRVRSLSPSVFTARRLSEIFGISPATVSRRLSADCEVTDGNE